ncbi:hypothetical protein, partial [Xylella fastidiosa]|uniref:hypothetical protein n=1 Tax=Xylella fastidiosa TaxID=2371 RepID=UPI001F2D4D39
MQSGRSKNDFAFIRQALAPFDPVTGHQAAPDVQQFGMSLPSHLERVRRNARELFQVMLCNPR